MALIAIAIPIARVTNLFAMVFFLSLYSGALALLFAILGAVDVAFTEAVVGTGVTTVFLVALLPRIKLEAPNPRRLGVRLRAWGVCIGLGAVMTYAVFALPEFGSNSNQAAEHLSDFYISNAVPRMHTPNTVTAVLADFRAFDTLIEATVVLVAALSCLLISGRNR